MSLLSLGFRPFYALAAVFAVVALVVWLRAVTGLSGTGVVLNSVIWHSHEMLFGFAAAVIAGFLFTAVRNWTGLPTPSGALLAALAVLWCAARVLLVTGPGLLAAAIDVAFLPAVAAAIAVPIIRSRNQRNYKVLLILAALATLNGVFHLANLSYLPASWLRASLFASIDVLVILLAVVAGRVIPAFTKNAVPESSPRNEYWVEWVSFASLLLVALVSLLLASRVPPLLLAVLLIVTAAAHATRLGLWDPVKTLHNPLLWMMPVAYSWIPFALLLRALAVVQVVPPGAYIHAVTIGAISSFMLAMMMRSSLGHTGRPLVASRSDMAAFLLLQCAAIMRVVASIAAGPSWRAWVIAASLIWIIAFLVFALRYLPMLVRPRLTG